MKLKKYGILVKNLLIKYVNNSKNYFNFNILKTNKAVTIDKNKILFRFQCKYKWSLNSWDKDVNREIFVVYNIKTNSLIHPELYF